MKSSDGRELPVLGEKSHLRQPRGPETNWQDSVVLVWWDAENAVGGFHRIGHEVGVGKVALWNTLFSPQGIYKKTVYNPLRESDLLASGGFGGGDDTCSCEYIDGGHIWTVNDGDVSARIVHRDTGPNVDCYPKSGKLIDDFAPAHLDVPGTVSGWIKIKGKEYPVKGLSIRDHGWGPRDWSSLYSHRWVAGSFGADLGFVGVSWHTTTDAMAAFGWVVRNGEITFTKDLDILTYVEIDGASNRGGCARFSLTTGEVLEIECTPVAKATVSYHHKIVCVDVMCRATCDGRVGFADFESSSNFQAGSRAPGKMINAVVENGFFPN